MDMGDSSRELEAAGLSHFAQNWVRNAEFYG
jgi:hypothetical protein